MTIRALQLAASIAMLLLLSACGGLSKNTKLTDESEKAIVIASVTQRNATQNMFVWIRRVSDQAFVPSIFGISTQTTPNLNVFEVEPGEYEFFRTSIVGGNAAGHVVFDKPWRFTAAKGHATYAGNFDMTYMEGDKLKVKILDNGENDIAEFMSRFPLIEKNRIRTDIAKN